MIVQLILLILFYVGCFITDAPETVMGITMITLLYSIIAWVYHLAHQDKLYKNAICVSYIILLSLLVVNLQTTLNVFFGVGEFTEYLKFNFQKYYFKCYYLGIISITAFMLGCCYYKNGIGSNRNRTSDDAAPSVAIWLCLLPLVFFMFVININLAAFISGSDYVGSGGYQREISTSSYYEQLLDVNIVIITAIMVKKIRHQSNSVDLRTFIASFPIVYWIVVVGYILLRLLSGDRGPVLYSLCLLFYAYIMCSHKRIGLVTAIVLIAIGASFITTLGIVRGGDLNESFSERVQTALTSENDKAPSICPSTQELANSVKSTYIAVEDLETDRTNYTYGKYNLFALISCVPGSSYVLSKLLGINLRETLSAEYITISYMGYKYSFGLGTSAVAEFYLDGGLLFCIIGFILVGMLYRCVDEIILGNKRSYPVWIIIVALKLASTAIYIGRASAASSLAKALYCAIIFLALNFIVSLFQSKIKHIHGVR